MKKILLFKKLSTHELATWITKNFVLGDVAAVLRAVHDGRFRSKLFCTKAADPVFTVVRELAKHDANSAEARLLELNTPPSLKQAVSSTEIIWSQVFELLVELRAPFSEEFSKELIRRCLTMPTDMGFGLCHSTVVGRFAKYNRKSLDHSLIEVVIGSAEDSRAIYALKIARFLEWREIRPSAFQAMLSKSVPKQIEAMWLVKERGTFEEGLSFAQETGIEITPFVKESGSLHSLTQAVLNAAGGEDSEGIAYAVRVNGTPLSPSEFRRMSERIEQDLKGNDV